MSHEPLPVFISYASYDNKSANAEERWLNRLMQFLKPLELEGKISSWADTELTVGSSWRQDIKSAVEKAKVAILLVSPAFLASEFIRTQEIPQLLKKSNLGSDDLNQTGDMEEGMLILPILLRPCLIKHVAFEVLDGSSELRYSRLSEFQYVPKGSSMNGLSQYDQDKQFEEIAMRIIDVLDADDFPISPMPSSFHIPSTTIDTDDLDRLLLRFLSTYKKWWFNALRIHKWGSKKPNFKDFGDYSLQNLKYRLNELAEQNKVLSKEGKKSIVYKSH
jgi:hypothetical protein